MFFKPKHIYTVSKDYYWIVYPSTQKTLINKTMACSRKEQAEWMAAYITDQVGGQLGGTVTFIEPGSNFMVVEIEGRFVKIVGDKVGWILVEAPDGTRRHLFKEITSVQT